MEKQTDVCYHRLCKGTPEELYNNNQDEKENKHMKQSKQMKRSELLEMRTANHKIFENQDHSRTVEIYMEPVHYQEEDGTWAEMDDTLEEMPVKTRAAMAAQGYFNKKGNLTISLAPLSDSVSTVSLKKGTASLTWGMEAASHVPAKRTEKNRIAYPGILPETDLVCTIHGEGVKEDLVLHTPEAVPESYTCLYQTETLHPVLEHNRVSFLDEKEEEVFCVYAPCMKDAAGEKSEAIRLSMEQVSGDRYRIRFTVDKAWLCGSERQFPVVIDPVTTTSKKAAEIYDAHVDSLNEEDNFQQSIILKTKGGDNIQRSFVRFELPELKTGDMVVNARLVLVSLTKDGKERTVQVHKVLQNWNSNSINWYNKPLYSETVEDLCRYKASEQRYITLDITRMVKDWYQNGGNYGLMFKDDHELTGYTEFLSSDCDNGYADMRPRIDISYVNYSGLEDYWSYHSQDVGRAGTVHVNDYNGNLILIHDTMETSGCLMPMGLSHVYNSNNRKINLGYGAGFCLNYHQRLEKVKIAGTDYYKHTDGDGTIHYFYYDSKEKKWKDEAGTELYLTIHTDGKEQLVIHDKEDNQYRFRNSYLKYIKDKNGNTLTVDWTDSRIVSIGDGAGRKTSLSYLKNSAGKLTYLTQVTAPSGKKKTFAYTSGRLTSITDIDGEKLTYAYDSNNMLTAVTNSDGYSVKYAYYSTQPYRVRKITEYGGTTEGNSLTLTYGYNSTKFTDRKNRSEIYRFNNNGNLLHIHDNFGHAASAKYNRSGNHVNCLENATKLQTNVVQLLKDPIIQAKTMGWKKAIGTGAAGAMTVNTAAADCMVGTRSLKVESTSLTSYVSWAQSVTLKKNTTYTLSGYVKAAVRQASSNGGACLRISYKNASGAWISLDSEKLNGTTAGFVRLSRSFSLPSDASSTTVNVHAVITAAIGTMYADMLQLETGNTPSRCNLVDNGDFQAGSAGFTKAGIFSDGVTTVGTKNYIPVQSALIVTGSTADIYSSPSVQSTKKATVKQNTHLSGMLSLKNGDTGWFVVRTASGVTGYLRSSYALPYIGGSDGENSASVGITGAVLRKTPSDSGAVVEETIPRGTSLALRFSKKDANGQLWYGLGMQIDTKRFYGYMKQDSIVRLYRNYPYGTMTKDDKLYDSPSFSGKVLTTEKKGTNVRLRGVLNKKNGETWYAVQWNGVFRFLPARYCGLKIKPILGRMADTAVPAGVGDLDKTIYKFTGDPRADKRLTKVLDITGKKGDTYMANAWGRGTSLPETDNDKNRRFGVEVVFVGADGKTDVHYSNFSPDILDWQFLSEVYVAKQDYTSIKISFTYCRNANIAFFDGLALYREEFGQSYTYDKDNNLISAVDAQKNAMKFEYNASSDLTGLTDPKGNKFKYEYDSKHNVTKGTSAMGLISRVGYDSKGNIIRSGMVQPDAQSKGTWVNRSFTADQNHVASVTDAEGNKTQYTWDTKTDLMTAITDGRGNRLAYGYDTAERLTSVTQTVTAGGKKQQVKNTYTYAKDKLTAIDHNGFRYGFGYDAFGNTVSAAVAGTQVVTYIYEPNNGNLYKAVYANGAEIRYTYDAQDRMTASYYKASASAAEQKLHSFVYDKEGNIFQAVSHMSGKTYALDYDFLDRLMRVRDEKGAFYEYTYDANNQMTKMLHQVGSASVNTQYAYDKDGRETETKVAGKFSRSLTYDALGRITRAETKPGNVKIAMDYQYPEAVRTQERALPKAVKVSGDLYTYEYDKNNNITKITFSPAAGSLGKAAQDTYQYDERNQLIREDSQTQNKTLVYEYDLGGNLTAVKEYAYTTAATLPAVPVKTEQGTYAASGWKDQLLDWNGTAMTYDAVGNMLTKGDTAFTWTLGRKLAGVKNGKNIQYFYDHTGSRTKKIVDGAVTEYRMAGDLIASETTGGKTQWYIYDSSAALVAVMIGGKYYFYERNLQNDVVALVDESGKTVVNYTYDSWGNTLSITGFLKDTVGVQNPFRYRGYYFDRETGMYYLKNRYYDPGIRRFICSDGTAVAEASPETLHNRNLYVYCDGNPITRKDDSGEVWIAAAIGFAVGAVTSVATQMIVDKKSFNELSWIDVGTSGVTGAMSVLGVSGAVTAIVSTVGDIISSCVDDGAILSDAVVNAAVGGAVGWVAAKPLDFIFDTKNIMSYTRTVNTHLREIRMSSLRAADKQVMIRRTKSNYYKTVKRNTKLSVGQNILSTSLSVSAGKKVKRRRKIGARILYNSSTDKFTFIYLYVWE